MSTAPRLRRDPSVTGENLARYAFGPLPPGFAAHLGGALRRVMIGCLPGPAIASALIEGAPHPFGTVPGVAPGVPQLLNRLARVRLAGSSAAPAEARLSVTGPATARAGDLAVPEGVVVTSPDQVLAEVSAGATLQMVATIKTGRGYAPREQEGAGRQFAVAGGHAPVARVCVQEAADDLLLEIETSGVPPLEALRDAAALLTAHLGVLLPAGDAPATGGRLPDRVRHEWTGELSRLTYAYNAAEKLAVIRDIAPSIAGPTGELLAAAVTRRPDPPAVIAEARTLDSPGTAPRLEISCDSERSGSECLVVLREVAAMLCGLLTSFSQEPQTEAVCLAPAPRTTRASVEGRVALVEPDLAFWPDDLLAIPRSSFATLLGPGDGSLAALMQEFFPIRSHDQRWLLDLLQVRIPQPALDPDQARQQGVGHEAPVLVRAALRDAEGQLVQEQEVAVGALPLMAEDGTFVLAGKSHKIAICNELRPAPGLTAYRTAPGATAHLAAGHGPLLALHAGRNSEEPSVLVEGRGPIDIGSVLIAFGASTEAADGFYGSDVARKDDLAAVRHWLAAARHSPAAARSAIAGLASVSGFEGTDAAFECLFLDRKAYDLGELGRARLNARLGTANGEGCFLSWQDIAGAALLAQSIAEGHVQGDEPVSLSDHVVWTPGRLLNEAVRQGLLAQVPAIAARMSAAGAQPPDLEELLEDLAVGDSVARHLASSPLVQPIDDTNRLARVDHCRRVRVSLAGTAGCDGVPLECRQIAADAAGRLCVLETPEGPNIGLVLHLAAGARLDKDGFLLAPLRRVEAGTVTSKIEWLHADDESGLAIAGPHASGEAIPGPTIPCRRDGRLEHRSPDEVDCVEAGHGSMFGVSASLIPISPHSDPTRLLMGANMQRQALEVYEPEPPLVRTGAEDRVLGSSGAGLGRNFLVAYLPWFGRNFEDAIVVGEQVAAGGCFSSVGRELVSVSLGADEALTPQPPGFPPEKLRALGPDGLARPGAHVRPGDVLVGLQARPRHDGPRALVDEVGEGEGRSLVAPRYASGTVVGVLDRRSAGGSGGTITVELLVERTLARGDKLSNRHGAKGVIGKVVPVEEMPVLPDGTPVEVVLSPVGVPSRLNLGQLLEASLGWTAAALRSEIVVPPGARVSREQMMESMRRAGLPLDGKVTLRDGRTGRPFDQPSLVGYVYLHKLDHLAANKIHARATGPYSPLTQQPTGGKAGFGGQRFGEMETWALQGYGAAHTLREVLTIKSDDVRGREAAYEAILRCEPPRAFGPPELLSVLLAELHALGLRAEVATDAE